MPRRNRNAGRRNIKAPKVGTWKGARMARLPRCDAHGGKVAFPSASAARDAIERSHQRRRQTGPTAERAYRCPVCGGWHLTHRKMWRD